MKRRNKNEDRRHWVRWAVLLVLVAAVGLTTITPSSATSAETNSRSAAEQRAAQIEAALFTRTEFFGAQAIVPYPTAEARQRLAEVQRQHPRASDVCLKLAELDEKLGQADVAQKELLRYVELEKNSLPALGVLADFYQRRARFAEEAAVREQMISAAPVAARAQILQQLIALARRHRLEKYQRAEFFQRLIASDPQAFEVVKQFLTHLLEEGDSQEVLRAVRRYQPSFPEEREYFLQLEVATLVKLGRVREAESVYVKAFDPFWSDDQVRSFYYDFLSANERLRAYGQELKTAFRRNPTDFGVAVRLFHYLRHDYGMDYQASDDKVTSILVELEQARARRGVKWTNEELAKAARILLANNNAELATRYLYTLAQQGGLARGHELRAQVLYQLFEVLLDAGNERTPLTAGDLKFYQDVATADPHPGMLGGVLSLVLADANPRSQFEQVEEEAVAHFNRAAAFRLFTVYKQEYPTSPQLAQMYLDLIRLYTASGKEAIAAPLLAEFEQRYRDAPQFPAVALKLADCYVRRNDYEKERALYQRLLDYFGQRRDQEHPLVPAQAELEELTVQKPALVSYPPSSNAGIRQNDGSEADDPYGRIVRFRPLALSAEPHTDAEEIDYASILSRYVASLARENRAADILTLYGNEIRKYPQEQGLYEQLLQWLGQTNLLEEQLRVYQDAYKRFPGNVWTDRLTRWYLRRERRQEFARLSEEVLQRLNEQELHAYLTKFSGNGERQAASEFDRNLYLSFYTLAHQRFPHNQSFVQGLLNYYANHKQWDNWRRLLAEYYFAAKAIREQFLRELASQGKLREALQTAQTKDGLPYRLFRADAAAWLSQYEDAVAAYRELNRLYPNTPEFAERLISFTRSFGQKELPALQEAAQTQQALADALPASDVYRTTAGELQAELGDYRRAAVHWEQLLKLGAGDAEVYLNTATVYWDYFQYEDALRVLRALRRQKGDAALHAFQIAALLETQHKRAEALAEYVKALPEDAPDSWRARQRLQTLLKREGVPAQLHAAFQRELGRASDREALALGYVSLLDGVERWPDAAAVLRREIVRSRSQEFLDTARDLFREHEDEAGEVATLRQLTRAAKNFRFAISYRLQLAEHVARHGQKDAAASILNQLVQRFPTNYGVLTETADFYWRLGKRQQAAQLLAQSATRSRGRFHYLFARKLAARQLEMGQMAAAETGLQKLYRENPRNLDVFQELTRLYVKTGRPDALRARYRETIQALKQTNLDRNEIRDQIEQLRAQVIEAFTQLHDYPAAVEQHIEIINRDPDDQESLNAAIQYAKRYGGAETLLAYYTKTSAEAYKDYRWNLVLARIYDAKNDWNNAAQQLRKALTNQPEMVELHSELAEVSLKAHDFNVAIEALKQACTLTNDDPQQLKRLADAYDKAGRKRDADAVRAKLPVEKPRSETVADQFRAAEALARTEREKAVETYRKAFAEFERDIYKHELRAHELTLYVETLRTVEPLPHLLQKLWAVRERIRRDTVSQDNLLASKARALLETFDRTLPEAVGRAAAIYATGEELQAISETVRKWAAENKSQADADAALVVLLNLSQRAELGLLTEELLVARKDLAQTLHVDIRQQRLQALLNFHTERGDYARAVVLLEGVNNRSRADRELWAEYARLLNDRDKELQALREEFRTHNNAQAQTDPLVERYFDALWESGDAGRQELRQLAEAEGEAQPHRFQLINFLVRNRELSLARAAIATARQPEVWKAARQADLSVLARDVSPNNDAYFQMALQGLPIGELLRRQPDATRELIGDNWFTLADGYGRWLSLREKEQTAKTPASEMFLPALLENRPKDAAAQWRLGRWYLEQSRWAQALEHLSLASEMQPGNKYITADLGSAYFKLGDQAEARKQWQQLLAGDNLDSELFGLYLRTLTAHRLVADARAELQALLNKRLTGIQRNWGRYDSNAGKDLEPLKPLIRTLVASFNKESDQENSQANTAKDNGEKAALLRQLCGTVARDTSLPEMVVRESLVSRNQLSPFYEMLMQRSEGLPSYERDEDFYAALQAHPAWSLSDIEEAFEHEQGTARSAPASVGQMPTRQTWQREYLDYLLAEQKQADAIRLIVELERGYQGRFVRPDWLRLAILRLDVRAGRIAQTMATLRRFALIEAGAQVTQVSAPPLDRLNQTVAMLRGEGRKAEADELLQAAYERTLALEQWQSAPFAGLARLQLAKGETDKGLQLLRLMTELCDTTKAPVAAAELTALPWAKARAVTDAAVERPAASQQLNLSEVLRLAAENTAEFGQLVAAAEYRQRLQALMPTDYVNRLELARVLAAQKRSDDAVKTLADVLADRNAPRQMRWAALWLTRDIAGQHDALWTQLQANKQDQEVSRALSVLLAWQHGQRNDAIALSRALANDLPGVQTRMLPALLQQHAGQERDAWQSILDARVSLANAEAFAAFSTTEDELRWQLVRLAARLSLPRTALKLAAADERLKAGAAVPAPSFEDAEADAKPRWQTLAATTLTRQRQRLPELQALLSAAAEQLGEWQRAADFERGRFALLRNPAERRQSEARIQMLLAKQRAYARQSRLEFGIDERAIIAR